jgi:hypothetical protein
VVAAGRGQHEQKHATSTCKTRQASSTGANHQPGGELVSSDRHRCTKTRHGHNHACTWYNMSVRGIAGLMYSGSAPLPLSLLHAVCSTTNGTSSASPSVFQRPTYRDASPQSVLEHGAVLLNRINIGRYRRRRLSLCIFLTYISSGRQRAYLRLLLLQTIY